YTPELVSGVWVGFDQPRSIGLPGAKAALPAWVNFMLASAPVRPPDFPIPKGIVMAVIDPDTGGLATPQCPRRMDVPFLRGTEPHQLCALHGGGLASIIAPASAAASGVPAPGQPPSAPGASASPAASGNVFGAVGRFFGSLFGHSSP
ncbi:MAG TPA: hypothetical protein VMB26_12760, partial [Candidatus Binataceae bacterium]|nr:hypothetical protein [Candidatus Binataceae bacterium]